MSGGMAMQRGVFERNPLLGTASQKTYDILAVPGLRMLRWLSSQPGCLAALSGRTPGATISLRIRQGPENASTR